MPPINPYNSIVYKIKLQYYCIKALIAKQLPVLGGQISKHKQFIVTFRKLTRAKRQYKLTVKAISSLLSSRLTACINFQ